MPPTSSPEDDRNPAQPPEPTGTPSGQRSRLEDEVLEILQRTDRPISFSEHVRHRATRQRQERWNRARAQVVDLPPRLGQLSGLGGFVLLALLAYFLRDLSPLLARLLAIASVICLLVPIVQRVGDGGGGPGSGGSKRWRGQEVDLGPRRQPGQYGSPSSQPAWLESLRRRFGGPGGPGSLGGPPRR